MLELVITYTKECNFNNTFAKSEFRDVTGAIVADIPNEWLNACEYGI